MLSVSVKEKKKKKGSNLEYKQLTWKEEIYKKEVAATLHTKKELGLEHIYKQYAQSHLWLLAEERQGCCRKIPQNPYMERRQCGTACKAGWIKCAD